MSKILGLYANSNLSFLASKVEAIEKKLKEYLIKDDFLSYEYFGKTRDFIFITGFNDEERELPPFDHPMMIDSVMNKKYIVVDLRKYVKQTTEKPATLKSILSNYSYAIFQINRAILLDMVLSGDSFKLQIVQENLAIIFSNIIASSINGVVRLTPKERLMIEGVCYCYVIGLFISDFTRDEKSNYLKPMLRKAKLTLPLNVDMVDELLTINLNASNFPECFENIKFILGEKSVSLQLRPFYNTISNIWYGPGTMETVLLSLDNISTMLALYLTAYNDITFKKSRITDFISIVKRKLDETAFKKIELKIKEYSH